MPGHAMPFHHRLACISRLSHTNCILILSMEIISTKTLSSTFCSCPSDHFTPQTWSALLQSLVDLCIARMQWECKIKISFNHVSLTFERYFRFHESSLHTEAKMATADIPLINISWNLELNTAFLCGNRHWHNNDCTVILYFSLHCTCTAPQWNETSLHKCLNCIAHYDHTNWRLRLIALYSICLCLCTKRKFKLRS